MPESNPRPPSVVSLTGRNLDPAALAAIARDGATVAIDGAARARIAAANDVVRDAARAGRPVYGVTTGLGSRATEPVSDAAGAEFSLRTIRGRAVAVGEPLSRELTRAAMAVRLNGLCAGGAGAAPAVAEALAAALNAGVHPVVPSSGSVGTSDLCLMAHVGLGLIGEGEAELAGERMPAAGALARAGLSPLALGPKDGLALCSSSAVAIGAAALALCDAEAALAALQVSAALSMEGFRANLSPLDPRVVAARPAPGQAWSAAGLLALLAGGELREPGAARRVQDPLSFRCVSQVHGGLRAALDLLGAALEPDLRGAADNPLVLAGGDGEGGGNDEIVSTGNFQGPALSLSLDAVAIALAQVAHGAAERQARCKTPRLSGLSHTLVSGDDDGSSTRSGVAPLNKTAHALVLEIRHLAAPLSIHSLIGSDGVEDDTTGAAQAALRVLDQLGRLRRLIAVELVVAAQAVDVGAPGRLGDGTAAAHRCVRATVPVVGEDRPLGAEVERLAAVAVESGALLGEVGEAAAVMSA